MDNRESPAALLSVERRSEEINGILNFVKKKEKKTVVTREKTHSKRNVTIDHKEAGKRGMEKCDGRLQGRRKGRARTCPVSSLSPTHAN